MDLGSFLPSFLPKALGLKAWENGLSSEKVFRLPNFLLEQETVRSEKM